MSLYNSCQTLYLHVWITLTVHWFKVINTLSTFIYTVVVLLLPLFANPHNIEISAHSLIHSPVTTTLYKSIFMFYVYSRRQYSWWITNDLLFYLKCNTRNWSNVYNYTVHQADEDHLLRQTHLCCVSCYSWSLPFFAECSIHRLSVLLTLRYTEAQRKVIRCNSISPAATSTI